MEASLAQAFIRQLILCFVIASQARQRGYSRFLWLLIALCAGPLVSVFLLALLPDQKLTDVRRNYAASLDRLIDKHGASARRAALAVTTAPRLAGATIGDAETTDG